MCWCVLKKLLTRSSRLYLFPFSPVASILCIVLCCIVALYPVYTIQPVVKPVVQPVRQLAVSCRQTSNRLSNRFDNHVERTATVRATGCQTGLYSRFDKHGFTTVLNSCLFNWLSNRVVQQPVWQPVVYTIQPVVKRVGLTTGCIVYTNIQLVVKPVWQPVLSNPFDSRFDNRLYRVNGALSALTLLLGWQEGHSACKKMGGW